MFFSFDHQEEYDRAAKLARFSYTALPMYNLYNNTPVVDIHDFLTGTKILNYIISFQNNHFCISRNRVLYSYLNLGFSVLRKKYCVFSI